MTAATDSRQTHPSRHLEVLTAQARLLHRRRECASFRLVRAVEQMLPLLREALEADANLETHLVAMSELENQSEREQG